MYIETWSDEAEKESLLMKESLLYSFYMFGNEIVSETTICIILKKKPTAFRSIGPNNVYIPSFHCFTSLACSHLFLKVILLAL